MDRCSHCIQRMIFITYIAICVAATLPTFAVEPVKHRDAPAKESLKLKHDSYRGYTIRMQIGPQQLDLKVVSRINGIVLFQRGTDACVTPHAMFNCYKPEESKTAVWCNNSGICSPGDDKYECKEVKSSESIKAVTATEFFSDGRSHHMETIEGFENLKIDNDGLVKPAEFDKHPVKMANNIVWASGAAIPFEVGGLFGLAGVSSSCRGRCLWTEMLNKHDGYYVIDLNGDREQDGEAKSPMTSNIHLGLDSVNVDEIIWSEKRQTGGLFTDASMEFPVYDMTMCGVRLFGKSSSYWLAEIDLGSKCLILPKNFWLSLMAQLPISEECYDTETFMLCRLKRKGKERLPEIEFRLQHMPSEVILRIPIENLLLDDSDTPELCIMPDLTSTTSTGFVDHPTIKFGFIVLESINAVVDSDTGRVGFLLKNQVEPSNDICTASALCKGDQIYIPELNYCRQPLCNIWFFKKLDYETGYV
ncbi:hypothetical protein BgAZ_207160 [Babesia gibsoni]|uniref:Peptidase A1 domain-containing protein n=1 Tax=Babesia gibsoni TaxID=33632 RepID=A0AAD8PEF7_BABGI|nr:hypothetical protein BgAZ_207160 [Babesia gibsoni]